MEQASKSCPLRSHSSFIRTHQGLTKYLGYFCNKICSQELSKIAQTGHTFQHSPFISVHLYPWLITYFKIIVHFRFQLMSVLQIFNLFVVNLLFTFSPLFLSLSLSLSLFHLKESFSSFSCFVCMVNCPLRGVERWRHVNIIFYQSNHSQMPLSTSKMSQSQLNPFEYDILMTFH